MRRARRSSGCVRWSGCCATSSPSAPSSARTRALREIAGRATAERARRRGDAAPRSTRCIAPPPAPARTPQRRASSCACASPPSTGAAPAGARRRRRPRRADRRAARDALAGRLTGGCPTAAGWSSSATASRRIYRQGRRRYRRAARESRRPHADDAPMAKTRQGPPLRGRNARSPRLPAGLRKLSRRADKLGELLGEDHDLAIFAQRLHAGKKRHRHDQTGGPAGARAGGSRRRSPPPAGAAKARAAPRTAAVPAQAKAARATRARRARQGCKRAFTRRRCTRRGVSPSERRRIHAAPRHA